MRLPSPARPIAVALAIACMGGCTAVRSHQGYIVDADLVNSVQPGTDNRQSVLATLGKPSFTTQFANQQNGGGDWFYIARESRNYGFQNPHPKAQITLQISFDPAGNVTAVRRSGIEQVASVDLYGKTTPTLGKKRSFFDDLFGNIGTVGAAGTGSADSGGGGGRTQP